MECPNTHEKSMCSGNISQRRRGFRSRRRSPQFREGRGTSIGIISQGRSPRATRRWGLLHHHLFRFRLDPLLHDEAVLGQCCGVLQRDAAAHINSFAHRAIDRNLWLMSDWFGRVAIFDRNVPFWLVVSWWRGGACLTWAPRRLVRTYEYVRRCAHTTASIRRLIFLLS